MPIFTMLEMTWGNQVHGVRAHRKMYDLACITTACNGLYLHMSIGRIFNFNGLTLRNERSWRLPKRRREKKTGEKTRSSPWVLTLIVTPRIETVESIFRTVSVKHNSANLHREIAETSAPVVLRSQCDWHRNSGIESSCDIGKDYRYTLNFSLCKHGTGRWPNNLCFKKMHYIVKYLVYMIRLTI